MKPSEPSELPFPASQPLLLDELVGAAASCTRCDLYERATQTVFGEGASPADVMLVGEQPGDQEDKEGRPFVGPAGRLLDQALVDAGIDRGAVYVTNAVKHFKWTPRGKRRIHQKPTAGEVGACAPWLDGELDAVRPKLVVALGATAAQALLGPAFRVSRQRGEVHELVRSGVGFRCTATVHPSAVLRASDVARDEAYAALVADLRTASPGGWLAERGK